MGVDQATKNIPKGKYHFGWSGSRRDYLMINYRKTQSSENKSVSTRQIKTAKPGAPALYKCIWKRKCGVSLRYGPFWNHFIKVTSDSTFWLRRNHDYSVSCLRQCGAVTLGNFYPRGKRSVRWGRTR